MTLAPGTRLGPYEILSPLGAGGMGEVYKARDTRLGREVAIKVLPEAFANDAERLSRFEREARSASSVSDPHIVTVFDVGAEGAIHYFASELVDGSDLRRLLDAGPVAIRKTVDLAEQIASGLATAHEKGVVHRDLKPENILLTKTGLAKIADFGLAKLAEITGSGISQMPTSDGRQTTTGVVMGTVGYMSPEQAGGRSVDFRSDQFALGTMFYELLSGATPFRRATAAETMTAILREDPEPLASLVPKAPTPLVWIVERCLAKEPAQRYAATRDLAHDLARVRSLSGSASMSAAAAPSPVRARATFPLRFAAVAAILATGSALYFALRPPPAPPAYQQLTFRRGDVTRARFAPDGQTVLYSASWEGKDRQIFLTRTNDRDSSPLSLPPADLYCISSSGRVAVELGQETRLLAETSLAAGAPRPLAENVTDASYQPGTEKLALARGGRIEFPIGRVLYDPGPGGRIASVQFSRDGDRIAFREDRAGSAAVGIVDLAGHARLLSSGWSDLIGLAWNPVRKEVWFTAREGPKAGVLALHAVSLSGRQRLIASAPGILVVKDIASDGRVLLVRQEWRFSSLFKFAGGGPARDLSWYGFSNPRALSPDGKTLLFDEDDVVYLRATDGASPAVRLGDGVAQDLSPDGKWALALPVTSPDRVLLLPTGPGEPRSLDTGGINCRFAAWSPDGQHVVLAGEKKGERGRLYALPVGGGAPRAISPEGVGLASPMTPDGKFVPGWAPGRVFTLYPVDGRSDSRRIVTGIAGDENPQGWDSTGRFLFLVKATKISRLEIATGRKEIWRDIDLADSADAGSIDGDTVHLTPDGRFCAYARVHASSELYLVMGLR